MISSISKSAISVCFGVSRRFSRHSAANFSRQIGHISRHPLSPRKAEVTSYKQQRKAVVIQSAPADVILSSVTDTTELESQQKWLAVEVQLWLDDEWTQLAVHKDLGEATAQAYGKARLQGTDEIGSVLLSISSDLLAFDFKETFVNAFDVSNKAVELLMKDMGLQVCCDG